MELNTQGLHSHLMTLMQVKKTEEVIFRESSKAVTEVILNNSKKMNFLTLNMLYTILAKIVDWEKHPEKAPRAIIMSGAGGVAFCSGGDMRGLYDGNIGLKPKHFQPTFTGTLYRMDNALANMKPVHIAIWNGYVFGSGAGICMRAHFTVATDHTEWAMPECVAGFITDNGASHFFSRLRNCDLPLGLYLAVTGQRVAGKNLLKWGLCTHFVPKDKIEELKRDLIENIKNDTTNEQINKIIDRHTQNECKNQLPDNYDKIQHIFQPDDIWKTFDRLNNYKDQNDPFIKETQSFFEKNSPISMALSFELVKRGLNWTVEEALQMDFRLDQALLNFPDYFKGVHNLLVNKDRSLKPNWVFKTLKDVTPEVIEYFFQYPSKYDLTLPNDVNTRLNI